ncbi:hypothetical protein HRbin29_01339 [bacterium HR29]|jgi:hypothetical protein|nr:hypothetical protein HRbin29_01339 [bacterium HR29]
MRFFDMFPPGQCEIPGCTARPERRVLIMGGSRAWLCPEHARQLERGRIERTHR